MSMNANTKNKLTAALDLFRNIEDNALMNISESAVDAGMFDDYTHIAPSSITPIRSVGCRSKTPP